MRVASYYPSFFSNQAIGYCILEIAKAMQAASVNNTVMGMASDKRFSNALYKDAIPSQLNFLAYRLLNEQQLKSLAESRFIKHVSNAEFVYLWEQGVSLDFCEKLRQRGHKIVLESVNTHRETSKRILDAEYKRLGLNITHGITNEKVEAEHAVRELMHYTFSCGADVKQSLIDADVPSDSILDTTYGLRESDILPENVIAQRANHQTFTAIFVGTIGVRKGPHLLLDYWKRAKIKGNLRLIGHIEEDAKHLIEPYLKEDNIEHVPFVSDLRDLYKEADVFVLPSLEEGSPLVTYLALGAGLPCIASTMGAGGLITDGQEGLIREPHDDKGWIEALQTLSEDAAMRTRLSVNAYKKAPHYLWSAVGRKRAEALLAIR